MSNKVVALLALPIIGLAWFAGLKTGERKASSIDERPVSNLRPGTPVATFDGGSISVEELKAQIEEQAPIVRVRYTSPEGKRAFLERMVRMELLAREAQRRGYDRDPEVVRQHQRNLVAVFVQKEFEAAHKAQPISEDEIKKFYDEHLAEFVKPERVRIAHLFVAAPETSGRAERRARAESLLATARAKESADIAGFQRLTREHSDDAESKSTGGDLRFLSREELARRAGEPVAQAAFDELKVTGEVFDRVVETPEGFHILKLLGRENPLEMTLEKARESIRSRIAFDRRGERYEQFVADIEKKAGLKVDAARLDALAIAPGGPARVPSGAIPPAPKERARPPVFPDGTNE